MAIMLYITTVFVSYITTFKDDFKSEDLQKSLPLVAFLLIITIILSIL